MAAIPIVDIRRVTIHGKLKVPNGLVGNEVGFLETWTNSIFFGLTSDPPDIVKDDLMQDFSDAYSDLVTADVLKDSVTWDKVTWADYSAGKWITERQLLVTPTAGANESSLPSQTSPVLSLVGEDFYPGSVRVIRGRIYLPPVGHDSMGEGGILLSAAQTAIADAFEDFDDKLIVTHPGTRWIVFSPTLLASVGNSDAGWTLDKLEVGNVFDTQRRRRDKAEEFRIERPIF